MNPEIMAHVEGYAGPVSAVIHETGSQFADVDILHVLPTARRRFHVLVTSGLSGRPMNAPRGCEDCRYGELYLCLHGLAASSERGHCGSSQKKCDSEKTL